MRRSGGQCEFERLVYGLPAGATHFGRQRIVEWAPSFTDDRGVQVTACWVRCADPMRDAAHVLRRWQCGDLETDDQIPLKLHPLVVIGGCRKCHAEYDSRLNALVRLPAEPAAVAARLIRHTLEAARARGHAAVDVDLTTLDDALTRPL